MPSWPLASCAAPGWASPNGIAEKLGFEVEHVGYHVRVLRDLGCIELVRTVRRRGFIEHYYRADETSVHRCE